MRPRPWLPAERNLEAQERIRTFRGWRALVSVDPERYRIRRAFTVVPSSYKVELYDSLTEHVIETMPRWRFRA